MRKAMMKLKMAMTRRNPREKNPTKAAKKANKKTKKTKKNKEKKMKNPVGKTLKKMKIETKTTSTATGRLTFTPWARHPSQLESSAPQDLQVINSTKLNKNT